YSLVSDYFPPKVRGKIYGLLELAMPFGYMIGMALGLLLSGAIGWRGVFYMTGSLGILLSIIIFFGVREAPRGRSEPELADLEHIRAYRFDWKIARDLFKKPSLRLLFIQGFFGVFPWNVITYWFFRYLEKERGYTPAEVFTTMVFAVLVLASGYFVGGAAGDALFRRTPRGRLIVSGSAVLLGAVLLVITLSIPAEQRLLFAIMLSVNALFIPFAAPNVISTVFDITLPEVRSTAMSIQLFIESAGAALAPLMAGFIAVRASLHDAILLICVTAWVLCAIFFGVAAYLIPRDIAVLREQLRQRAEAERIAVEA
ncbi:MAG: MFS transporter, partial [Anaerolineae bacterium]